MKKLLTVLLAALMVFALVGCSKKEETPADTTPADDGVTKVAVLIPHRGDQSYFDTIAGAADEVTTSVKITLTTWLSAVTVTMKTSYTRLVRSILISCSSTTTMTMFRKPVFLQTATVSSATLLS